MAFYCSIECQTKHWKTGGHKRNCKTPEERSVAKAEVSMSKIKKVYASPRLNPNPPNNIYINSSAGGAHARKYKTPPSS